MVSSGCVRTRPSREYHSLQTQLDKRFSGGLSAGVHYTWSRFEDTASEIFNPSAGEVAVAQDSFNLDGERGAPPTIGRTGCPATSLGTAMGNTGVGGKLLGGWQISSFFTCRAAGRSPC